MRPGALPTRRSRASTNVELSSPHRMTVGADKGRHIARTAMRHRRPRSSAGVVRRCTHAGEIAHGNPRRRPVHRPFAGHRRQPRWQRNWPWSLRPWRIARCPSVTQPRQQISAAQSFPAVGRHSALLPPSQVKESSWSVLSSGDRPVKAASRIVDEATAAMRRIACT
jgi:hypothetical protein